MAHVRSSGLIVCLLVLVASALVLGYMLATGRDAEWLLNGGHDNIRGGGKNGAPSGSSIVAFALPTNSR